MLSYLFGWFSSLQIGFLFAPTSFEIIILSKIDEISSFKLKFY